MLRNIFRNWLYARNLADHAGHKKGWWGKKIWWMVEYRIIQQFWGAPRLKLRNSSLACRLDFLKIFGRKQSTSKTVPRGALAIGLLRSSCLVGVCVCAPLYLQFKLQNLWVLGCSPKISGAGPVLCRFRPLISNFPATGQCHKLFAVTLESKRRGRTLCHWHKTFKFCPVKLLQSHVSTSYVWCLHGRFRDCTYGLHYPLEYDLMVRFKVKAATKTGLHLNYYL